MGGLYQRVQELYRRKPYLRLLRPDELRSDSISAEERESILDQINRTVINNRLDLGSETRAFKPRQSGLRMPLVINLVAAVMVAAGVLILFTVFDQRQESIVSGTRSVLSAEGKLIEAVKQQSQEQISQKDREIREIQSRLTDISRERTELRDEMESRIAERDARLQEELRAQLAAERERLRSEGMSAEAVESRLRALEEEKSQELEESLADYRTRMQAELAEREAAIAAREAEYRRSLEEAREARLALQEQMERREAELERRYQERESALEADRSRVAGELERLRRQQDDERLALDQILTFYRRTNERIGSAEYQAALETLGALREFLATESVLALPAVQNRRSVELFIITSLERFIRDTYLAGEPNADPAADLSGRLSELGELVLRADELYRQGDSAGAAGLYEQALRELDPIWTSYSRLEEMRELSETEQQRRIDALIAQADRLYLADSLEASVEQYRRALALMKEDAAAARRMVDRIFDSGFRLGSAEGGAAARPAGPTDTSGLDELLRRLRWIEDRYGTGGGGSEAASPEMLTSLLEAKLLAMQIMASEPVRSRYPDLYETMERYFRAFGEESTRTGYRLALERVNAVLDALLAETGAAGEASDGASAGWDTEPHGGSGELLLALLEKLRRILASAAGGA